MMKHPETKHEMEDEDHEDHIDGLTEHIQNNQNMPEHHRTIIDGMIGELNDYKPTDEESSEDDDEQDADEERKGLSDREDNDGSDDKESDWSKINSFAKRKTEK